MAEKIMIASGKGGVGKSTVCLCLGAGLAVRGKKVLIIEADTGFRGLDITLALEDIALYDLSDILEKRCVLESALLRHNQYGMHLICAPNDPEYLPQDSDLTDFFNQVDQSYDYILVDCGAGFGAWQGKICRRCDLALVVTMPTAVAVRAAAHVSQLMLEKGLKNQRLIINRIPKKLPPSKTIYDLDDVIDLVGVQLIGAIPEDHVQGLQNEKNYKLPAYMEMDRIAGRIMGQFSELLIY